MSGAALQGGDQERHDQLIDVYTERLAYGSRMLLILDNASSV
jgi:hypothetical protein